MPATGLLLDPAFRLHHTGSHHPECPERLDAIEQALHRQGLQQPGSSRAWEQQQHR